MIEVASTHGELKSTAKWLLRPKDFRVRPGHPINLHKWPTQAPAFYKSKSEYQSVVQSHSIQELSSLQSVLNAGNRYAVLLSFQGMDAAGKDSAIRHVMSGVNPQACQVFSFKEPGSEELAHDFLWRAIRRLPERGHIGIFNRSYYEEVLVVQLLPGDSGERTHPTGAVARNKIWDLEIPFHCRSRTPLAAQWHANREVLSEYLQGRTAETPSSARIDQPDKNWKLSVNDIERVVIAGRNICAPTRLASRPPARTTRPGTSSRPTTSASAQLIRLRNHSGFNAQPKGELSQAGCEAPPRLQQIRAHLSSEWVVLNPITRLDSKRGGLHTCLSEIG